MRLHAKRYHDIFVCDSLAQNGLVAKQEDVSHDLLESQDQVGEAKHHILHSNVQPHRLKIS